MQKPVDDGSSSWDAEGSGHVPGIVITHDTGDEADTVPNLSGKGDMLLVLGFGMPVDWPIGFRTIVCADAPFSPECSTYATLDSRVAKRPIIISHGQACGVTDYRITWCN